PAVDQPSLSTIQHPPHPRLLPYTTLFRSPNRAAWEGTRPKRVSQLINYSARRRTIPRLTRRPRSPAPDLPPPAAAVHAARERRLETPQRRRKAHRRRACERAADANGQRPLGRSRRKPDAAVEPQRRVPAAKPTRRIPHGQDEGQRGGNHR